MAYVSETPRAEAGLSQGWFSELADSIKLRRARHAEYMRVYSELNAMSEIELADIGLSSLMVRDVALQAAERVTL